MRAVLLLGALDILQLSGQIFICGQILSQANERADDQNVQFDGAIARQHRRKHRNTVLGEYIGQVALSAVVAASQYANLIVVNLVDQSVHLIDASRPTALQGVF